MAEKFDVPLPDEIQAALAVNDMTRTPNRLGLMKGKIKMVEDFDAPLPDEIQAAFYEKM